MIHCLINFLILILFCIATKTQEDLATLSESLGEKKHTQPACTRELLSEKRSDRRIGEKRSLRSPEKHNSSSKFTEIECSNANDTNSNQNGELDPINATKAKKTKIQQIKTN